MDNQQRIIVIPCSGIGKPMGSVGRKATYLVTEKLRPSETGTLCLALLTVGDKEARKIVQANPCIAIDGCPARCASKNISASKGKLAASYIVTDVLRQNRGLIPKGIIELNQDGLKLVEHVAEKVVDKIDELATVEKKGVRNEKIKS
ncbi:MAG: putative zinc-binding protein [Candidatus Ranarchaeia archaeon]